MAYILEAAEESARLELQKEIEAYSIKSELNGVDLNHKNILDAGCGGGDVSEYILGHSLNSIISGCDASDIRVAHAKKKNPEGSFFQSSLEDIDSEKNTYDLIICRYVFEYLEDPLKVLNEFKRVAKSGAEIILIDLDGVFKNLTTSNEHFNLELNKVCNGLKIIDFHAGRKLTTFMKLAGLRSISNRLESFLFTGKDLIAEKENNRIRLSNAMPHLIQLLGEDGASNFRDNYLTYITDSNSSIFLNKFTVRGQV